MVLFTRFGESLATLPDYAILVGASQGGVGREWRIAYLKFQSHPVSCSLCSAPSPWLGVAGALSTIVAIVAAPSRRICAWVSTFIREPIPSGGHYIP